MIATSGVTRLRTTKSLALAAALSVAVVAGATVVNHPSTGALFTNQQPVDAALGAARIFSGERVTPAFAVDDQSSGSTVDRSSASAFGSDSRYFLTRVWSTSFDTSRYLEFDLNGPLPLGLPAANTAADLRVASDNGAGSVCLYAELRQASDGTVLSTHGSAGSPLGCTSGTSYSTVSITLSSVTTTDVANNLRLRVYARDSAGGQMRVDQATVGGQTPYSTWTLYPILTREAYSGQTELLRWGFAGQ